jgi:hypothetical protein
MAVTTSVEDTEPKMACGEGTGSVAAAGFLESSGEGECGCSDCCGSGTGAEGAWMGFRVKTRVSGTRKDRRAWARSA